MNEQDLNSIVEANDFIDELSDEALDRLEINSDNVCHTGNGGCEIT